MITLPPEIMEQIKFFCSGNNFGMSTIVTDEITLIMIGNSGIPPNYAHLIAAQILIEGILSGRLTDANAEAEQKHEEEKERKPF